MKLHTVGIDVLSSHCCGDVQMNSSVCGFLLKVETTITVWLVYICNGP